MTEIDPRITELSEQARRDQEAFEPPAEPPNEEAAVEFLTEGVGAVVRYYIDARTGEQVRFGRAEFALLERALNDWLELYAACYGTKLNADFSVREVAEVLIETHSIRETAILLTRIPDRDAAESWLD